MYHRGGKVWVEENGAGLVSLESDWQGGSLPENLVSEYGFTGVDFRLADSMTRARYGGYVRKKEGWLFFLARETIDACGLSNARIFLAGEVNDWSAGVNWELLPHDEGLALLLEDGLLAGVNSFAFKFVSECGRWIEPHPNFPSLPSDVGKEARNGSFDRRRTGEDLVRFDWVEPRASKDVQDWAKRRPEGSFGYRHEQDGSSFRIFAPRAQEVRLLLGKEGNDPAHEEKMLVRSDDGSWSVDLKARPDGLPYRFVVSQLDGNDRLYSKTITDPYARAVQGRDGPGIALPREFVSEDRPRFEPPAVSDAVVVEAHLRDLLAHAPVELNAGQRMEFAGLSEWLRSEDCYLRKLGANVVELQPLQEFDAQTKEQYHWGYMPVNFFSPASVYSGNPKSGQVTQEFESLVDAFHQAGLALVLDVVYNHVGIPPHLMHLDRELYFMRDESGKLTNHSGCGNDLWCESEPARKIILDSLIHWVEAYDVDGFRFDLGELLGCDLLSEIETELRKIKPGILLFAEPWSFRGRLPKSINQTGFSLWSDTCREELLEFAKGRLEHSRMVDFLSSGLDLDNLHPWQSLNYLESHDDYCLVDRFRDLVDWGAEERVPDEVRRRVMLALGVLFCAPGIPMISAGQDFLRHKRGKRNTYENGPVNALDYDLLCQNRREVRFVRSMIRLRLGEHGRRARQPASEEWVLHAFPSSCPQVLIFGWEAVGGKGRNLLVANPTTNEVGYSIPEDWMSGLELLEGYGDDPPELGRSAALSFSWFACK